MRVDTSHLVRIPVLVEMVRALSAVHDPKTVLAVVVDSMRKAYGPRAFISLSVADLLPGQFRVAHFINYQGEKLVWNENAWDFLDRLPVSSGGFLSDVIRDPEPKLFLDLDIQNDPVLGNDVRGLGSAIAIPMYQNGEPLQWTLLFRRESDGFDVMELEQSLLRVNLVGSTINQAMTAENLRQADLAIQREVDQIADIQRALLPEAMPKIPGMTIAASYATYDRAGGDYYDFLPIKKHADGTHDPDGPWAFIIADASGHGPAAAVVTAMLHAVLYTYDWSDPSPSGLLEFLNKKLFHRRIGNSFVTAFVGIFDPKTRMLRYANAGHPPALIKDTLRDHSMHFLDDVGGRPLGIFDDIGSEEGVVELLPGQTLVLFTDGITDARSPAGEFFGHDKITASLVDCNGQPACVIGSVTQALRRHEAGRRPRDDQTLVAAHLTALNPAAIHSKENRMPPTCSIVVASGAGGDFLFRALDSLKDEAKRENADVYCPDRIGGAQAARLKKDYPWVKVIDLSQTGTRPSIPELRAAGVRAATGDVVAILEEHCLAPAGWLAAIRNSFQPTDAAIGGPILDHSYDRLRDWCVYFSEYNNYLPPWPEGERYVLNGANIAYDRRRLLKHEAVLGAGYWEVVLHPLMAAEGKMRAVPGMGAHHTGPFDYGYYLEQRYLLSRVWGGTQRARVPFLKRLIYLCLGPFLPFVLYARTALRVMKSGEPFAKFLLASPLLFGALFAYVWGEWLGYLVGPGDALERVE